MFTLSYAFCHQLAWIDDADTLTLGEAGEIVGWLLGAKPNADRAIGTSIE
jgi:hypothetical protein